MKRFVLTTLAVLTLGAIPARAAAPASDTLDQGLFWLYHAQYDKARASFESFIKSHPDDPAGYFYLTATSWWQLAQNLEYDLPDIRARLEADSHTTMTVAEKLFKSSKDPKAQARACLYWGGAEGLWGRWLVTQREWVSAYFAGKRGYRLLKKALKLDHELYDAYLGLGIYDYFTDTLSGVQAVLAAMLIHGDKDRGLLELQTAIDKGEHSKVEAMTFMVEIFTSEEHVPQRALPIAEALAKKYPQSPVMAMLKISALYSMESWDPMLADAQSFLEKAESETPWFTKDYVLPARYLIGVAKLMGKKDLSGAEKEMRTILAQAQAPSRFIAFARLRMGQIYDLQGKRELALQEYRGALNGIDVWGLHADATRGLREAFTFSAPVPSSSAGQTNP